MIDGPLSLCDYTDSSSQYMESAENQNEDEEFESLDEFESEEEQDPKGLDDDAEGQEIEAQIEMPKDSTSQHIENPGDLKFDELQISDLSDRSLSRSPPRSQRQEDLASAHKNDIKAIVSSDLTKKRSQQQRKYHSKRSTRNAGRQTGSKAKQDKRVRLGEHRDVWD